ncbi:MAG: VanZ family protein [Methylotenera sp.]
MIAHHQLIKGWLPTLAFCCMLAALFIGGAQSGAGALFPNPWDKLAHVVFFFSLTLFLSSGFNFSAVTTAILSLLIGMLDELHQVWLPGRFAGFDDWLADVVGVVLAIGVIYLRKRS